ncbi:MAG TPA: tRNA pseudouridine(55) synthase TruB [Rhodothermales bacterium]
MLSVLDAKVNNLPATPYFPPDLPESFESLVLPVDKPSGWSSFDVVRKLRRLLRVKKIGHAGTLDPMATGLLICLVGKATRQMEHFMHLPKEYVGTMRLGQSTDTYDAEGTVVAERPWQHVDLHAVRAAAEGFVGEITQRTPMYSAVKVGGERLYRKARRGEDVERPMRQVTVYAFDVTGQNGPDVDFRVACSRGTYIRSLASDLGEVLGCGAHLVMLRRTAIGETRVEDAWTIEMLEAARARQTGEGA